MMFPSRLQVKFSVADQQFDIPDIPVISKLTITLSQIKCDKLHIGGISFGHKMVNSTYAEVMITLHPTVKVHCTLRYDYKGGIVHGHGMVDAAVGTDPQTQLSTQGSTSFGFYSDNYAFHPPTIGKSLGCKLQIQFEKVQFHGTFSASRLRCPAMVLTPHINIAPHAGTADGIVGVDAWIANEYKNHIKAKLGSLLKDLACKYVHVHLSAER